MACQDPTNQLDTFDLEVLIQKNPCLDSYAEPKNVFAADELSKAARKVPRFMIVNTDPISKPGQHWVAIFVNRRNEADYFDSFAESPPPLIAEYLRHFKNVNYSQHKLQDELTFLCGLFAYFFIAHRCQGYKMRDISNFFSFSDYHINDEVVRRFALQNLI